MGNEVSTEDVERGHEVIYSVVDVWPTQPSSLIPLNNMPNMPGLRPVGTPKRRRFYAQPMGFALYFFGPRFWARKFINRGESLLFAKLDALQ